MGHKQAFAWIDEWVDMTYDDVRQYEENLQSQTNNLVRPIQNDEDSSDSPVGTGGEGDSISDISVSSQSQSSPKSPTAKKGGYFSWF